MFDFFFTNVLSSHFFRKNTFKNKIIAFSQQSFAEFRSQNYRWQNKFGSKIWQNKSSEQFLLFQTAVHCSLSEWTERTANSSLCSLWVNSKFRTLIRTSRRTHLIFDFLRLAENLHRKGVEIFDFSEEKWFINAFGVLKIGSLEDVRTTKKISEEEIKNCAQMLVDISKVEVNRKRSANLDHREGLLFEHKRPF